MDHETNLKNIERDVGRLEGKVELMERDISLIQAAISHLQECISKMDRKLTIIACIIVSIIIASNTIDFTGLLVKLF